MITSIGWSAWEATSGMGRLVGGRCCAHGALTAESAVYGLGWRCRQEHAMQSKGSAVWKGGFKDGRGSISTASGALKDAGYSVGSRFEGGSGTNPEELIAAAHAACFSMALSLLLGNEGLTPESIETTSTVSLDKAGEGFEISSSHLQVVARIPA